MSNTVTIRPERPEDHAQVEDMIRRAFYNLYIPGCAEHYLAHTIRPHPDFLPELDLVLEADGQIAGNIMYTRARLVDRQGEEKQILTFGPLAVEPALQRRGYGKLLIQRSFEKAVELGYDTVVIFGDPNNYVARGFQSCKRHNVCLEGDSFPAAMLVKELLPGALDGRRWYYHQSPAFEFDEGAAAAFDDALPVLEKKVLPCQESFFILSQATLPE